MDGIRMVEGSMSDKPILFSAPMVRALLAGTKTQTRRLFKWQGPKGFPHSFEHAKVDNPAGVQRLLVPYHHPSDTSLRWGESGYIRHYGLYEPGDRLYVRETFVALAPRGIVCPIADATYSMTSDGAHQHRNGEYTPGLERYAEGAFDRFKWRPSIHMPRWASRLTLTVTDVRVQRLQEISDEDAVAEGTPCYVCGGALDGLSEADCHCFHRKADAGDYRTLWDSINGPGSWEANPWVAAYSFTVARHNIDRDAEALKRHAWAAIQRARTVGE